MERWYPDRIGGMFTANAEAVADIHLQRTSPVYDIYTEKRIQRIECSSPTFIRFYDSYDRISGWVKIDKKENIGTEIYLATLATLWGAPAAPLVMVNETEVVLRDAMAFSPACFVQPIPFGEYKYSYKGIDPYALGAAGQFKWLINDWDGEQNMVYCDNTKSTRSFHLIDYGCAEPHLERTAASCERFISNSLDVVESDPEKLSQYKAGAELMCRRIATTSNQALVDVAEHLRQQAVVIKPEIVSGLISRKALLKQPQYPRLSAWDTPAVFASPHP